MLAKTCREWWSKALSLGFKVARRRRRAAAMARLERLMRPLPGGFKFDRDEANER